MKTAIVTGAAGFAGCNLTEHLLDHGYTVYAVIRPGSVHNHRLQESSSLKKIELDTSMLSELPGLIRETCDVFFHLSWQGSRNDMKSQLPNINNTLMAVDTAKELSCSLFLATGSQAEYGVQSKIITEDLLPDPFSAYGAAKTAACFLSRQRAGQLGIGWIWGRIFSLYGKYEPSGRMLPDLIESLKRGETPRLSSCRQYWDYLDAEDAAEALIALSERGRAGEIYNIANGEWKHLKAFTERVREYFAPEIPIHYGDDPDPFVSLKASADKLKLDTGWYPVATFEDGLNNYVS